MSNSAPTISRVVITLAALAVIAGACSSDDGGSASSSAPAEEATEEATEDATEDPTEAATEESTPEATEEPTEEAGPVAADPSLEPFVVGHVNMNDPPIAFPEVLGGAELAVEYINAELGGIDGHPVELVSCSANLDNESNQACAEQFANDDSVQVVSSGFLIGSAGFHPTFTPSGKPHVGNHALTVPDYDAENTFYYLAGNPGLLGGLGVFTLDFLDADIQKAAVIYDDNPGGASSASHVVPVLEEGGIEVAQVAVPNNAVDLIGPLTAAEAADADAIFLLSLACVQLATDMEILGIDAPVLTTGFCANPDFLEASGGATEGWYVGLDGPAAAEPSPDSDFWNETIAKYDSPDNPLLGGVATEGFSNLLIIHEVASEIGWDNLSSEALIAGFLARTGPVFLGAPEVACPGQQFPTICTGKSRVYQIDADGNPTIDATGGEFVDVWDR